MNKHDINPIYGVPNEEITCPGCGRMYGHHHTKVDTISEECSTCCHEMKRDQVNLVDADKFITEVLGYQRIV